MTERDLRQKAGIRLLAEDASGRMPDSFQPVVPSKEEELFGLSAEDLEPNAFAASEDGSFEPNIAPGCKAFLGSEGARLVAIDYEGNDPDERINIPDTTIFQASDLTERAGGLQGPQVE